MSRPDSSSRGKKAKRSFQHIGCNQVTVNEVAEEAVDGVDYMRIAGLAIDEGQRSNSRAVEGCGLLPIGLSL